VAVRQQKVRQKGDPGGTSAERVAWGQKMEAVYSILYHQHINESRVGDAESNTKQGAQGVYVHDVATKYKAINAYTAFLEMFGDRIHWRVIFELVADKRYPVKIKGQHRPIVFCNAAFWKSELCTSRACPSIPSRPATMSRRTSGDHCGKRTLFTDPGSIGCINRRSNPVANRKLEIDSILAEQLACAPIPDRRHDIYGVWYQPPPPPVDDVPAHGGAAAAAASSAHGGTRLRPPSPPRTYQHTLRRFLINLLDRRKVILNLHCVEDGGNLT
jgi:hypothetical protein